MGRTNQTLQTYKTSTTLLQQLADCCRREHTAQTTI